MMSKSSENICLRSPSQEKATDSGESGEWMGEGLLEMVACPQNIPAPLLILMAPQGGRGAFVHIL